MKLNCVIFMAAITMLFFAGCGGGSKSDNPMIGKWKIVEATGTMADMNKGTVYNFVDETHVELSGMGMTNKATYTKSGDTLKYSVGSVTLSALAKVEGNKMNLEVLGSDQKFVLEKQ